MGNTSVMNIETHAEFGATKSFRYGVHWQTACQLSKHADTRIFAGSQWLTDLFAIAGGMQFAMRVALCNAK